ncbi:MAG: hypothetical protein AAF192_03160 [Pseudomonadota bacterium]
MFACMIRRPIAAALLAPALLLAAAQTRAQDDAPAPGGEAQDFSDAARQALEEALERVGPMLQSMLSLLDDVTAYEAPRVLENGDILIPRRRETPADPRPDPETDAPDTLDL